MKKDYNRRHARVAARWIFLTLAGALLSMPHGVPAQTRTQRSPARQRTLPKPATPSGTEQPKFKGIWEPVSYPEDLYLMDVFFVNQNVGWVVGGGGKRKGYGAVALYTSDGGDHWTVNLGDPQSNVAAYHDLRFIDERHGWMARGNDQLLRTVDGQNWEVVGKIPDYYYDYLFTSPTTGVMSSSGRIQRTVDGGRTWNPVFTCRITLQTNGLTQDVECTPQSLHFPSPQVGYFVAYYRSTTILGKTVDGGETWRVSVALPEEGGKEGEVFFLDENSGFLVIANGNVYATSDGGQSWHQLPGVYIGGRPQMKFADPQVGWSIIYRTMAFTTDGRRWTSRDIGFPAPVNAFSLPRRDRGYVVGEHGMIYRYRMVPLDYAAKGMIPAPLLSGIDSPLDVQVQQLATQVQQLAKDAGVPPMDFTQDTGGANAAANGGMNPAGTPSSASSGSPLTSDTTGGAGASTSFNAGGTLSGGALSGSIPGCPGISLSSAGTSYGSSAQTSTSYNAASIPTSTPATSGAFAPDTGNASTANAASPQSGISAGFTQDTSAATATVTTVSNTVPQFVNKYRNLNLLLTGFQVATQMPATVQCLKQSFQALKSVKDPQAAMAAVMNIQGQMGGLLQMVRTAFQKH